jgi:hypothetical protein
MLSNNVAILRKLPKPVAKVLRDLLVYPRYWAHARKCRQGYKEYGSQYKNSILFVVGIPKSGTTWLEKMLSSYPGYSELLIPEATLISPAQWDMPDTTFTRMRNMLVLSKMHMAGTPHNANLLANSDIPYAILYRDLRDVCISNYYYVRLTPWHYQHDDLINKTLGEYIDGWIENSLPGFCRWVDSWDDVRNPERSIMVRYENILDNPHETLRRILELYELPATDERINDMVEKNSFDRLSGGRAAGQEKNNSFFRKGKAGDWKNHFTDDQKAAFKRIGGEWLIRHGYESDLDW